MPGREVLPVCLAVSRQDTQAAMVLLCIGGGVELLFLSLTEHCQRLAPVWTCGTVNTREIGLLVYHAQVISLPARGTA